MTPNLNYPKFEQQLINEVISQIMFTNRQFINQNMEAIQRCQVCFITSTPHSFHQAIITCGKCQAPAHRYCYLPTCDSLQFICDSCESEKKEICMICENPGLMKRVGKHFAHPICLLSNPAFLVNKFSDMSFLQIDKIKPSKTIKCSYCKIVNGNVHGCGLSCNKACHVYCAAKNYSPTDNMGWRICLHICDALSNYSDLFERTINRLLISQHPNLKRKLVTGKSSKKNSIPLKLYCQQHSIGIIDCKCMDLDGDKEDWVYCDGCCRWQHFKCIQVNESQKAQIVRGQIYFCDQCITWKQSITQSSLVIPEVLPKFHIYDNILIQTYLQEKRYQVSPHLLQYALKLPIFPGKLYVQHEYRNEIAKRLRRNIDFQALRKQIDVISKCEMDQKILEMLEKIFFKQRQKLQLIWWLGQCEFISTNVQNQPCFLPKFQKFDGQLMNVSVVKQIIELLLEYENKFIRSGKIDELKKLKTRLEQIDHQNQTTRSLVSRSSKSKEQHLFSVDNRQKTIAFIADQLKKYLHVLKEKKENKQSVYQVLGEIHALINRPEIEPFTQMLPPIPIVQASVLFKNKSQALRFFNGIAQIESLKIQYKRINDFKKCQDKGKYTQLKIIFCIEVDKIFNSIIARETNYLMAEELNKRWKDCEINDLIPSTDSLIQKPNHFIHDLVYQNISLEKVNQILENYMQKRGNKNNQISINITQLTVLQKLLVFFRNLKFTKQSQEIVRKYRDYSWSGEFASYIPKIINEFASLYGLTELLLNDEFSFNNFDDEECLFEQWERWQSQMSMNDDIDRLIKYFKDIEVIRLHFFSSKVRTCLRNTVLRLVQKMEERATIFGDQTQYKLLNKWCLVLQISPSKMSIIFEKDRLFQSHFNCIKVQFDNIYMIKQLQTLLVEHLPFCKFHNLQFRVHLIKVLLTWIDLQKSILHRVPASLLLSSEDAEIYDHVVSNKPDYYVLRELYNMMKIMKFPNCLFFERFQKLIEEGDKYNQMINKVLDYCNWSYDLSVSLDWQRKLTLQQFEEIRKNIKQCHFYFEAEIIQLDIIKSRLDEAEKQAQILKIQCAKGLQKDYFREKAKRLIISFGSFPIMSQYTQFLWSVFESVNLQGFPSNLQAYVSELEKSHRLYLWNFLDSIRLQLHKRIESKYLKQDLCKRLQILITPNRQFNEKFMNYLTKYKQGIAFNQAELQLINGYFDEYSKLQFEDDTINFLQSKYYHYRNIKFLIKWHEISPLASEQKLRSTSKEISIMHPSFLLPQIIKFKNIIQSQLDKEMQRCRNAEPTRVTVMANPQSKGQDIFIKNIDNSSKISDISSISSNFSSKKIKYNRNSKSPHQAVNRTGKLKK